MAAYKLATISHIHPIILCLCVTNTYKLYVFVMHKFVVPIFFCALAQTMFVTQFLVVGAGGWLIEHQPTKNQALLPSLSTHPLASSVQKKSLLGAGGVSLIRGKQEVEAPAQGEAMAH